MLKEVDYSISEAFSDYGSEIPSKTLKTKFSGCLVYEVSF